MATTEKPQPVVVIAAGGTGGHMFPAQAFAEAMLARGWAVTLSTDARGLRFAGGFPRQVLRQELTSATFARAGLLAKALVPLHLARGIMGALWAMLRARPALVVGFGGYPSIPALSAAYLLRIPRMIHEQNGVLGQVNRLFARRVDAVVCGTWPTALPDGARGVHLGNPVRAAVIDRAGADYIPPGDYPMSVLAIGGSQAARVISDLLPDALAALPQGLRNHVRIAHQARPEDIARVTQAYAVAGIRAEVAPFFDDIPRRLSEAQLVISRAGASSVADITVIGRPAILIPYAAALGDHQAANARGLLQAGGAVLVHEAQANAQVLSGEIARILSNPRAAQAMAAASLAAARPNAAHDLADLAQSLVVKA